MSSFITGYISVELDPPKVNGQVSHGFGVSFYVTVWALLESPLRDFQLGLPSTWIKPENPDVTVLLCPTGTYARDQADEELKHPERSGDWSNHVSSCFSGYFQTIEGGVGFWSGSTQFPTKPPKFRILGIPDCYTTKIGSPGWPWAPEPLHQDLMGLAQLSNRILVPPDGMPLAAGSDAKRLGVAWMALPLTDYDGYYRLQHKGFPINNCLEWFGTNIENPLLGWDEVQSASFRNTDAQLWRLVPNEQGGGFYLENRLKELQYKSVDPTVEFAGGVKPLKMIPAVQDYYYIVPGTQPVVPGSQSGAVMVGNCLTVDRELVARMAPLNRTSGPASRFPTGFTPPMPSVKDFSKDADTQLWRLVPQAVGDDVATGDSSWTLFLSSANFSGPVAFFPPATWSRISKRNLPAVGRGLDARMASMRQASIEVGTVPGFQATLDNEQTYLRIPKLLFPTETDGGSTVTPCMQDITLYSRQAIYAAVMRWFDNPQGPAASGEFAAVGAIANKIQSCSIHLVHKGQRLDGSDLVETVDISKLVKVKDLTKEYHTCSWGLLWDPEEDSGLLKGHFPEYFVNGKAVPASSVPKASGLATAKFARPDPNVSMPYVSPTSAGAWTSPGPVPDRPPQTVTLSDGSKVTYAWYKFVDQPALQNLKLTEAQKRRLQARIVLLHKKWLDGKYMKPPSKGSLVSMDPMLIVKPPGDLEFGYVPIVIKQEPASTQ